MPRKNHIANGRANRIGTTPCGRNSVWPGSGAISHRFAHSKAPEKIAIAEKTRMIAIEMIDTTIANLKEIAAPAEFSPMNSA